MAQFLALLGSFLAFFAAVRYLLLINIRIHPSVASYMVEGLAAFPTFMFTDEFGNSSVNRDNTSVLIKLPYAGTVFVSFAERLLTAGYSSKECICSVTCFRWQHKGLLKYLIEVEFQRREGMRTPVEMVTSHGLERIGYISDVDTPYLEPNQYEDIDTAVAACAEGQGRVGVILYGPPGCGKTSLVKWLARKHRMAIRLFIFTPDMDNRAITRMFAQLPPKSIVLFEDFDSYFHGRTNVAVKANKEGIPSPAMGASFDAILNGLDGVYNNYDGIVFIMTANDLDRIDDSLKKRPSRFRVVRNIPLPSLSVARRILGDSFEFDTPQLLNRPSLDELLAKKDSLLSEEPTNESAADIGA